MKGQGGGRGRLKNALFRESSYYVLVLYVTREECCGDAASLGCEREA